MKTQLTQQHVDDFIFNNFVKSIYKHDKIIKLNTGVYMYANQAATLATFEFKKDFDFEPGLLTRFLISSFNRLQVPDSKQLVKLSAHYYHWGFFDVQFKEVNKISEKELMKRFQKAMPYESSDRKTFHERLKHWAYEHGCNLNVKGWPNRLVLVGW